MFFAGVVQARDEPRYRAALQTYIKAAAHAKDLHALGLFTGLPGLIAACDYAMLVEPRYAGLLERCATTLESLDYSLFTAVKPARTYSDYDMISGMAGNALAWASVGRHEQARLACDYLAWLLQDSDRWYCRHPVRTEQGPGNDLGMAHGLAGIVAALAIASPSDARYDDAIGAGLAFLSATRNADGRGWPARVSTDGEAPSVGRSAWCYGTPGCASALLLGARRIHQPNYEDLAIEALQKLSQISTDRWLLADYAICHGFAGNALVYYALGHAAGDVDLCAVALHLVDQIVDAWQPESLFGYRAVSYDGTFVDAPGLLDGAAGTGLALLTVAGYCDPSWLRFLGVAPIIASTDVGTTVAP